MAKGDYETKGVPRRPAFDLVQGYILCSVLAALDDAGVLQTLEEKGVRIEDVGGNGQLARDTVHYLVDRGVVVPEGDLYHLSPYGVELLRDRGYIYWIAGGFGEPFWRFGELLAGTHRYGADISRDGRIVAVSSAQLGRDDLKPYVHSVLGEIDYTKAADFGCGNARNLIGICQLKGARGLGVDISPDAIAEARREVEKTGLGDTIDVVEADASDAAAIPDLESVDLVVGFFFMHEVLEKGLDAYIDYLRVLHRRLPVGAHVLAAEVLPPERDRAGAETFTPEFTLIHALMGQGLLGENGWRDAFEQGGFTVRKTVRPNIPGGLLLLAQKTG
ncbi:class I SAM-dependent methyltransferase [Streptomyces sp. NPDC050528]|uniref:class I SAM-dependent methyltransferase n=1 Tax=unclassified Streptomyces TaxID=2593676 RepID=UPI0037AC4422